MTIHYDTTEYSTEPPDYDVGSGQSAQSEIKYYNGSASLTANHYETYDSGDSPTVTFQFEHFLVTLEKVAFP
jgi:hypothetical protein